MALDSRGKSKLELVARERPKEFVVDGNLDEWSATHGGEGDWVALAFTDDGLVLAGKLSAPTSRAVLRLTMPRMRLPGIGPRFDRAGVVREYNCVQKPYSQERLSPAVAATCRRKLQQRAHFVDGYEAAFTRQYVIDALGIREPGASRPVPTLEPAREIEADLRDLEFETTLAPEALPDVGASPIRSVYVELTQTGIDGTPEERIACTVELPTPFSSGPQAKLRDLLFATVGSSQFDPALSYRPADGDFVTIHGHPYVGPNPNTLTWIRSDPTRLVSRRHPLSVPGKKLGRVEVRHAPTPLGSAFILVDGEPKTVVDVVGPPTILMRDGEVQLLSVEAGTDDASLRSTVNWTLLRVSIEGEVIDGRRYSTLPYAETTTPFHDVGYTRIGATVENGGNPFRVEWQYDSSERDYVKVQP